MDPTRLAELISSNVPPSALELERARALLTDSRSHAALLRLQISELESELSTATKQIELYNQILSPIRRLPAEILTEIFLWLAPTPGRHASNEHLVLCAICRSWREIALGISQLWNTLSIKLDYRNRMSTAKCTALQNMTSSWFGRMKDKTGAISLCINAFPSLFTDSRTRDAQFSQSLIVPLMNRIRHLYIGSHELGCLLAGDSTVQFLQLSSMVVWKEGIDDFFVRIFFSSALLARLPELRRLSIAAGRWLSTQPLQRRNLTHLIITDNLSREEWDIIIQQCCESLQLGVFFFTKATYSLLPQPQSRPPIEAQNLVELVMIFLVEFFDSTFFDHLLLPSLKTLRLGGRRLGENFITTSNRSSALFHQFSHLSLIHTRYLSSSQHADFLQQTPNLTALDLEINGNYVNVLTELIERRLLQKLQVLTILSTINSFSFEFDVEAIAKLSGDISCQGVLNQVIIYIPFMNHVRMPHGIASASALAEKYARPGLSFDFRQGDSHWSEQLGSGSLSWPEGIVEAINAERQWLGSYS